MTYSEQIALYDPLNNTFVMDFDTIGSHSLKGLKNTVRVNLNHQATLYMTPDALRDWAKALTKAANRLDPHTAHEELIYTGNPE